jgi:threonine/homoserine/homoserine lactone efflux protein
LFPVLLQSLLLAFSGLLSFGSITLVILLLMSDRGWRNGLGYALGYTSSYTLIGISAVLFGYRTAENNPGEPGLFLPILLVILGFLLLLLALRNWRKPVSDEQEEPRFFSILDKITPVKAFGFGALIAVINFKNLALFLTSMSVVILSNLLITEKIFITLLVVLVFCLAVIIPVAIYIVFPRGAKDILNSIKQLINRYSRPIGIWVPLIFGLILLARGFSELL